MTNFENSTKKWCSNKL